MLEDVQEVENVQYNEDSSVDLDLPMDEVVIYSEVDIPGQEIINYTDQLNNICSIGLIIIFSIGLLSGISLGKILWERVTLWK